MPKSPLYIPGTKSHIVKLRKQIKKQKQLVTICGKVRPITAIAIAKNINEVTCKICIGVNKAKAQRGVAGLF